MAKYQKGVNRNQVQLLPASVDDYVDENNSVRVIDAFVETLDLEKMKFNKSKPKYTGRPPYDPKDLLKLYLYGYMNRIRSTRPLAKQCEINLEVIWLLGGIQPDFRTISEFRKDNKNNLKKVFHEFIKITKKWDLLSKEEMSQDGSKFQAVNAKDKNFTQAKLYDRLKRTEEEIERYLNTMDEVDETEEIKKEEVEELIKVAREKAKAYNEMLDEMEKNNESQKSLTDPESRMMKCNGKYLVGYNVQTVVEGKNHIVVDFEVTNQVNDNGLLSEIGEKAKEQLGVRKVKHLADGGYVNEEDMKECFLNGTVPVLPKPEGGSYKMEFEYHEEEIKEERTTETYEARKKCFEAGVIPKEYEGLKMEIEEGVRKVREAEPEKIEGDLREEAVKSQTFVRDIERDIVYCPGGKILRKKSTKSTGETVYCNKLECQRCPKHKECTRGKYREVSFIKGQNRVIHKGLSKKKVKRNVIPSKEEKIIIVKYVPDEEEYKRRKCLSEHPFGTVKRGMGAEYVLLKGREKVTGEMSLIWLGYNMKIAINKVGVKEMVRRLREEMEEKGLKVVEKCVKLREIIRKLIRGEERWKQEA